MQVDVFQYAGELRVDGRLRRLHFVELAREAVQKAMDFVRFERLDEVILHAQAHGGARVFKIGVSRENGEPRLHLSFLQLPDQFEAVHHGHPDVHEDQAVIDKRNARKRF